jgi:head-tail adaptor
MAYTSGLLKYRVTILNKQVASGFGETTSYPPAATVWADITWSKGSKALREGALDAYDTVLIRMRYNDIVTRESRGQVHDCSKRANHATCPLDCALDCTVNQ